MNRLQQRKFEKKQKQLKDKLDKMSISEIENMINYFQEYLRIRNQKNDFIREDISNKIKKINERKKTK